MSAQYPNYIQPQRRGLPGWAWALIIAGGAFFLCGPVAIIAAILFPVFAQSREKARQVSCMSNVKQLSTALLMYEQDYGRVPSASNWSDGMYPYVKSYSAYACPSD